jgi:DNA-binding transcriptional MerR regulator
MDDLELYRRRVDLRLEELIAVANGLLPEVAGAPRHGKARERLDERSVRYYVGEGLVDRPLSYAGTAALYGYRHLLQLLVIKRLQGEGLSLRTIRHFTAQPDGALEGRLTVPTASPPGQAAAEFLTGLLKGTPPPPPASAAPGHARGGQASRERSHLPQSPIPHRVWQRHELAEGLELHVSSDFTPLAPAEQQRVRERLQALLRALGFTKESET